VPQTVAKVTLTQTRKTPGEGFPLFRPFRTKNSPFLRFLKAKGDFAVCGRRQGLFALDLSRFFIKKLRKKFYRRVLRQAAAPTFVSAVKIRYL